MISKKENGWTKKTFGDIADIYNGNSISVDVKKKKFTNVIGTPFIGTKDVDFDGNIDYENGVAIPNNESNAFKEAMANSVLVCAEGGSAGRKCALLERNVFFGNKLFDIVPYEGYSAAYIYYFVQSSLFQEQFKNLLSGIIGGVGVNKFKGIRISIPNLKEQLRIASVLENAFKKIDALKANAEKNLQNSYALFQRVLANELEPKEGWISASFKELAKSKLSYGSNCPASNYDGKVRYVRITDIDDNGFLNGDCKSPSKMDDRYFLHDGDVLFARTGATVGKSYRYRSTDGNCIYAGYLIRLIPNREKIDPDFLFYSTKTDKYKKYINDSQKVAAQPNVNAEQYGAYTIDFPKSLEDQQKIVSRLNAIKEKNLELEKKFTQIISDCSALKKSILRKAFNGEL